MLSVTLLHRCCCAGLVHGAAAGMQSRRLESCPVARVSGRCGPTTGASVCGAERWIALCRCGVTGADWYGRVRRVFQINELEDVTSLSRACRNGNLEMVRWLVADVGVDPLVEADGLV